MSSTLPDEITYKKLVLVKQLYQRAIVGSQSGYSAPDRILVVIIFDLACETAIKAIITSLDSTKTPDEKFQSLIDQADSILSKNGMADLPNKAQIRHVHAIRNDAQHKAKYPNENDVSDCRTYTRDFLTEVIKEVWTLDFEDIRLSELVKGEKAKASLFNAETAFAEGNYSESLTQSSIALDDVLYWARQAMLLGQTFLAADGIVISAYGSDMKVSRDMLSAFKQMQELVLFTYLGINYVRYKHFRKISGHVYRALDGSIHANGNQELDQTSVEFALQYCIETIIQIEDRVGDSESILNEFGQ